MSPEEDLGKAQAAVEEARKLLLTPSAEALERSVPHLERAIACLGRIQSKAKPGAGILAGLRKLRLSVDRTMALFESAGGFHVGWAEHLALISGGYTAQGAPAAPRTRGKLSVEG